MEAHIHTCKRHGHFPCTITNLLASNGKLFQDVEFILICVGLRDMCIVPGIIAEGNYPAYHMEECTIEQYNLGKMEGILPESNG